MLIVYHASSMEDEMASREKAIKTLVAGQQAENLLDFDEPDSDSANASLSGIAATQRTLPLTTAATASILTSVNPLDELVSIFGNANVSGATSAFPPPFPASVAPTSTNPTGSFGALSPTPSQPPKSAQQPQDDLLGLF